MDWKIFGQAFISVARKFLGFAALVVFISMGLHFWPVVFGIIVAVAFFAGMIYWEYSDSVWDQQRVERKVQFNEKFGKK